MFIVNVPSILKMACTPASWKLLAGTHRLYRGDPGYSPSRLLRAMLNASRGEKIVPFGDSFMVTSFLPPIPSEAFLSVLNATRERGLPFTQQATARRSAPISFFLALTSACTCSCFHCSARDRSTGTELSTGDWVRVIGELQDMGTAVIGFTGGEPLLRPDLETIIGSVDKRSSTILYTNGLGLTTERAATLKTAGLFAVGISLDSADGKRHDGKRGVEGAFSRALLALRAARNAGLYTMAQAMVPKGELDRKSLFRLFSLAKANGAHEVRILEPIPSGALLSGSPDQDALFFTAEDRKKLVSIQYAANRRPWMPKVTTFAHTESGSQYGCGAGTQHSCIMPSGELLPCDFVPLSFGNVRDSRAAELWRGMNDAIGNPKTGCFAVTLRSELAGKAPGELPLPPGEATTLCQKHAQTGFPGFYRLLQGKRQARF